MATTDCVCVKTTWHCQVASKETKEKQIGRRDLEGLREGAFHMFSDTERTPAADHHRGKLAIIDEVWMVDKCVDS